MSRNKLKNLQPVQQDALTLLGSAAAAGSGLPTTPITRAEPVSEISFMDRAENLREQLKYTPPNGFGCKINLKVAIFFDGTGNNQISDLPTLEHSNVVRLRRAMLRENKNLGLYSLYAPGIGTPFPEAGDNGKGPFSFVNLHGATGGMGQARIDWMFKSLQDLISEAEPRWRGIPMISLSIFGFSRGAALARAFLQQMTDPEKGRCCVDGQKLTWVKGNHPIEIKFMGLWDTVASVGIPMSANNVLEQRKIRQPASTPSYNDNPREIAIVPSLSACGLAFGNPGADPAPGPANGHDAWGGEMALIGNFVERCVHMVSAHEQRNSFPLDSLLKGSVCPPHVVEIVYPGVHSDVGGGYRPGEGGLGIAATAGQDNSRQDALKLSQISLHAMYKEAFAAGVHLRAMEGPDWGKENRDDFILDPDMVSIFNYYIDQAKTDGLPLGDAVLRHMRLYFEWRFRHIRLNDREKDDQNIQANEKIWDEDFFTLTAQLVVLKARQSKLQSQRHQAARNTWRSGVFRSGADTAGIEEIDSELDDLEIRISEVQARIDTLPSRGTLVGRLKACDQQLVDDAKSILAAVHDGTRTRDSLRPHYRNLLEAYENEAAGRGLRDEKLIAFFDNHVHDSLADFDNDSTLPSDPRVLYVGDNFKMRYAKSDRVRLQDEPAELASDIG